MAAKKTLEKVKLTKYEKARIIGSRALQLSMGAPIQIKMSKKQLEEIGYDTLKIANLEMEADKIPIQIKK